MNNKMFKCLEHIENQMYGVEVVNPASERNEPIKVGF